MALFLVRDGLSQHSSPIFHSPKGSWKVSETCAEINPSRTRNNALCISYITYLQMQVSNSYLCVMYVLGLAPRKKGLSRFSNVPSSQVHCVFHLLLLLPGHWLLFLLVRLLPGHSIMGAAVSSHLFLTCHAYLLSGLSCLFWLPCFPHLVPLLLLSSAWVIYSAVCSSWTCLVLCIYSSVHLFHILLAVLLFCAASPSSGLLPTLPLLLVWACPSPQV